jgi:hypothetical protein
MSTSEFDALLPAFEAAYKQSERAKLQQPDRQRGPGGGRKAILGSIQQKLYFILFYFRLYPTQTALGFFFKLTQSQACHWIGRLSPILEAALGKELQLPARKALDLKQLQKELQKAESIIDGTERPINRPQDADRQREDYSGKKKRHTKKNIVVTDKQTGKVIGLGETQPGSKHDKKCAEEEGYEFAQGSKLYQDKGFEGYKPEGAQTIQPQKKPRGKELTEEQRQHNRQINKERVKVEHTIGAIKVYRIVRDVFRNRRAGFVDQVMVIACGLFNFCRTRRLATA